MRYVLYLLACLIAEVVAVFAAPILPIFSRKGVLPRWLSWFATPDNSLYGDAGWREYWCGEYGRDTNGWVQMTLWLLRNRAYGFKWGPLGASLVAPVEYVGKRDINRNNGTFGEMFCWSGDYWQLKIVKPIGETGYCFMGNFGWLLDDFIDGSTGQAKALFLFSPRIAKIKGANSA